MEPQPPLAGISSMAMRTALSELVLDWKRRSGSTLSFVAVGGVDAARRIEAGEPFDLAILAADAIETLLRSERLAQGSRVDLARSRVALAVRSGAPHPAIGDEEALRVALLEARRIGYSTGPSGAFLEKLIERWGLVHALQPRLVRAPPGIPVAALLARGEADLGVQQLSELVSAPGVEVIGTMPATLDAVTTFSGAVCAASTQPEAARAALAFLACADADAAKRRHGLEPAR
jgi:molybdate transport system substrate-binding protein